jgi:hypothetical protein
MRARAASARARRTRQNKSTSPPTILFRAGVLRVRFCAAEVADGTRRPGFMRLSNIEQVATSRGGLWVFEHVLGELNFR